MSGSGVDTAKIEAAVEKDEDQMELSKGRIGGSEAVGKNVCKRGEFGDASRSSGVNRSVRLG